MTATTRRAVLALGPLGAAAALMGCQTTQATATVPASTMSQSDLDFVADAFNIIEFDRQECTLAQTQAMSPEVRALAAKLLQQANEFDARLRPVAMQAGIKPPTVLRTNLRVRAARLRLGQGRDFDRAFVDDQIVSHQDTLNMQEMVMNEPGGDPQLAALSKQGYELVRTNLASLRDLQKTLMTGRNR